MRRKDRLVTDEKEIRDILDSCRTCRLGFGGERPYIVPLNYGYTLENCTLTLYFHSAMSGKKVDLLKQGGELCIEIDQEGGLIPGDSSCDYGFAYRSIIGWGTPKILETGADKIAALDILMERQTGKTGFVYHDKMVERTFVFAVKCSEFTVKECDKI